MFKCARHQLLTCWSPSGLDFGKNLLLFLFNRRLLRSQDELLKLFETTLCELDLLGYCAMKTKDGNKLVVEADERATINL